MEHAKRDPQMAKSLAMRKAAMHRVVEMDHSSAWLEAIKYPSRPSEPMLFLPGNQVYYWKKAGSKSTKGRMSRSRTGSEWHGPGVIIGHDWDDKRQLSSYWVAHNGRCFLIPYEHLRHAEHEELMAEDEMVKEMKKTMDLVARKRQAFYI